MNVTRICHHFPLTNTKEKMNYNSIFTIRMPINVISKKENSKSTKFYTPTIPNLNLNKHDSINEY